MRDSLIVYIINHTGWNVPNSLRALFSAFLISSTNSFSNSPIWLVDIPFIFPNFSSIYYSSFLNSAACYNLSFAFFYFARKNLISAIILTPYSFSARLFNSCYLRSALSLSLTLSLAKLSKYTALLFLSFTSFSWLSSISLWIEWSSSSSFDRCISLIYNYSLNTLLIPLFSLIVFWSYCFSSSPAYSICLNFYW